MDFIYFLYYLGDDYTIMKDLNKPLYLLSENVHKYAFDIVFAPIKYLVKSINKSNVTIFLGTKM